MEYKIDSMKEEDWLQVSRIYSMGIETDLATFQPEVPTWEAWNRGHIASCRFVARLEDKVIGWVALSPFSSREVYAGVAELSIYIDEAYQGRGVGTELLHHLIERSEDSGYWSLLANIIKENQFSRMLHKKCGFREIGYRERMGKMRNGKWHDVVLMERRSKHIG
ncbi:MAG: sortase-like acyltransferase [Herbinix sp.]|jgi:phosphinothricin acetyltransferase|nr:sortase-like acyltransferase [Herbinix sp.]